MGNTLDHLKAAFAGESQANRKYTAFAQKAEEEGYPQIARLFRAAAHAETIHAINHLKAMNGVSSTQANLDEAIGGENYEVVSMYPQMIEDAASEGEKQALRSFRYAWEVEKVHEELYRKALAALGETEESYDYYVCPVCGYTHARNAPDKCPVCGAPAARFQKIG